MTQNWSILAKFATPPPPKKPAKLAVFYWLFRGEVSPWNFPWNRPISLWISPWKSFEIWLFSAKMPRNRPIFLRILTFLPRNRPIFPQILTFFPWKSREIARFFCKISEALVRVTECSIIIINSWALVKFKRWQGDKKSKFNLLQQIT